MPEVLAKVHGGIINDQTMNGSLQYYQLYSPSGIFANTVSYGTVLIPGMPTFGGDANVVGEDRPVPRSAAELAFQVITGRCSVVHIKLIDDSYIQFAVENTSNNWYFDSVDVGTGVTVSDIVLNIQGAVRELGVQVVPNNTVGGVSVDFSNVVVVEKQFILKNVPI